MSDSTTPRDLRTEEGWNDYVQFALKATAERSSKSERTMADCTLYCTKHPTTGAAFAQPMAIIVIGKFSGNTPEEADNSKDAYMQIVRAIATAGGAIGAIFSSEMWFSMVPLVPGKTDYGRNDVPGGRPSADPQRKEGITLVAEHQTFADRSFMSIIERTPDKTTRTIGPWEEMGQPMGDMTGFVPPRGMAEQLVAATPIMRDFIKRMQARGILSKLIILEPDDAFN